MSNSESPRSNYYMIAGLLVIIGILALVALCVCILNFKRLLNILKKSDGEYHIEEHATELQEVHPLTTDSNRMQMTTQLRPPSYQDCRLERLKDGTSV